MEFACEMIPKSIIKWVAKAATIYQVGNQTQNGVKSIICTFINENSKYQ